MRTPREVDQLILNAAARRESVIHSRELRALRVTSGMVKSRIETDFLVPVLPGTYAVGPAANEPTFVTRCMAALLFAGDGSRLDGTTAARLHETWDRGDEQIHVSAPRNVRRQPGDDFRFHRRDSTWRSAHDLSCGSLVTVGFVDVCIRSARSLTMWQLAAMIRQCIYKGLVTFDELVAASVVRARAPGNSVLREAILLNGSRSAGTRSKTEDAVLADLLAAGVPEPLVNVLGAMGMYRDEPDLVWASRRKNLEIDGRQHDEPSQSVDDRQRDAEAVRLGWQVMRLRARDYWRNRRGSIRRVLRFLEL